MIKVCDGPIARSFPAGACRPGLEVPAPVVLPKGEEDEGTDISVAVIVGKPESTKRSDPSYLTRIFARGNLDSTTQISGIKGVSHRIRSTHRPREPNPI